MSKIFPSVKAIIIKDGKFLIVKEILKNKIIWDLPGGKIKYGESPYDALIREVKEETTLKIKIIKPIGIYWFLKILDKKQAVCTTFLCRPKISTNVDITKNPAKEEMISEYKWVTKNEFLKNCTKNIDKSLINLIKKLDIKNSLKS